MKTNLLVTAAIIVAAPAFAHSGSSIPGNLSRAAALSANASGQAVAASGEIAVAAVKTTAGAAALAFWTGGSTVAGAGHVVKAVGDSTAKTSTAVTHGADHLWDFASGDPARRPTANRERSVPPLPRTIRHDPPPSEMFKTARR